jgi:acyl-CoA thioester hydrolase
MTQGHLMAQRTEYLHFQPITTRWHDNDVYGHVNNVTYYSFFDTAVNTYLIQTGGLDIHEGEVVGFVVSSACDYFASIAFPDRIEVGLRVGKLGNSSVQYELAVFKEGGGAFRARVRGKDVESASADSGSITRSVGTVAGLKQKIAASGLSLRRTAEGCDLLPAGRKVSR